MCVCVSMSADRTEESTFRQSERTDERTQGNKLLLFSPVTSLIFRLHLSFSLYQRWTTNSCCTHSACFGSMMCFFSFLFERERRPRTVSSPFSFSFYSICIIRKTIANWEGEAAVQNNTDTRHSFSMIWADRSIDEWLHQFRPIHMSGNSQKGEHVCLIKSNSFQLSRTTYNDRLIREAKEKKRFISDDDEDENNIEINH